jgi:hypothetical protein
MNAKIFRFPDPKKTIVYKIPLYTDEDIFLTVLAVNMFGSFDYKITASNLEECDPTIVIAAISQACTLDIFSDYTKQTYINIIESAERLEK